MPSASRKISPPPSSRSDTNWATVSIGMWGTLALRPSASTTSWVAKLTSRNTGTAPPVRVATLLMSASFSDRNDHPGSTSTAAFTPPPNRVAMPPARITTPTCPAAMACSPAAVSAACSGVPGAGSANRSSAVGGWMRPRTMFACFSAAASPLRRRSRRRSNSARSKP